MMDNRFQRSLAVMEIGIDRSEVERAIQEAFVTALGEGEVIDVHVSQFPHEYGAIVLLRYEPSKEAEALALEQEERFRAFGIDVGILLVVGKTEQP